MGKTHEAALVPPPPPVSSSDEGVSGSDEKDVSDSENDGSDTDNYVADSDSESEGNDGDSENNVVEGSEDEQPIGLLKEKKKSSGAGASSSSKVPEAESGSETESDRGEDDSVSSPDSDGFTVRQAVVAPEKEVEAERSRRRPAARSRSRSGESEAEKKKKRKKVDAGETAQSSEKEEVDGEGDGVGEVGAVKSEKRALFQRLWSEEDEMALLLGLGEYELQKGRNPFNEMEGFFDFIKDSINIKVTQVQLVNKARRMRRKFARNDGRAKDGKDPSFKRPHDRRVFEVSKTVWGGGKLQKLGSNKRGRPFGSGRKKEAAAAEIIGKEEEEVGATGMMMMKKMQRRRRKKKGGGEFWARYPCVRDSVEIFPYLPDWGKKFMMERLVHSPEEKLNELEEKWKELRQAVGDLHLRHIQLLKETMMLQDGNTSDNV